MPGMNRKNRYGDGLDGQNGISEESTEPAEPRAANLGWTAGRLPMGSGRDSGWPITVRTACARAALSVIVAGASSAR